MARWNTQVAAAGGVAPAIEAIRAADTMTYRIAINQMALSSKLPQGDPRWAQFNDSFRNQELDLIDIADRVYMGHAYTAWHSGRRKRDNWQCAQHIAVDMETHDKRSSIHQLMQDEFIQVYGAMLYTTPSHTADDPRARIVFLLDQPITDPDAYEVAAKFVYSLFPGADMACTDCSRSFNGSLNCDMELLYNVLPVNHLRSYYNRWRKVVELPPKTQGQETTRYTYHHYPPAKQNAVGVLTPDAFLDYAIQDAVGEGRNNRGYRLARQLREIGLSRFEAEPYIERYQRAVATTKEDPYTEAEARANVKSAYGRGAVH